VCGIAGIISLSGRIEPEYLRAMSTALRHRGPDGYGYLLHSTSNGTRLWHNQEISRFEEGWDVVGFAHRRLSIIDLSLDSIQPMYDEANSISVVYNGEIYNYLELRAELEKLGYFFRTSGDTEVLLKAYAAWGTECVKHFNGMWAFALLDTSNQKVILARDRFGIKPLYYAIHNKSIYFASEIKGLIAAKTMPCSPNESIISCFLMTGLVDQTEETFFEGIYSFPAAHLTEVSLLGRSLEIHPRPYWSFPGTRFEGTEDEAKEQFRDLFLDATRIHSRSDVPVGTCLSGGIDSSSIVCASEILRKQHKIPSYSHSAFGYCSADEGYSEKRFMQAVVDKTGVQMHFVEIEPVEFIACLPSIIRAQDEPFGSASIAAQWFVFNQAKQQGMIVMLDGQGADEILGGYHYYFNTLASHLLRKMKIAQLLSLRDTYEKEIGPFPISLQAVFAKLMPKSLQGIALAARQMIGSKTRSGPMSSLLRSKILCHHRGNAPDGNSLPISLKEALRRDVESYSLPALLRYEDRNSMDHSIESRVPFLDYRLVDFAFMLPDEWKIRDVTTKHILRACMEGILPESIRNRKDKIGFRSAPSLTFDFISHNFNALVENKTDYEEQWFNQAKVEEKLRDSDRSAEAEFLLWRIVNTKLWARHFWG
jgi:asparagine synthase (glutamine-hydrolysing)